MYVRVPIINLEHILRPFKKKSSRWGMMILQRYKTNLQYHEQKSCQHHISVTFAMMTIGCLIDRSAITTFCQQDTRVSSNADDAGPMAVNQDPQNIQNHDIVYADQDYETCPFCRYFLDSPCSNDFKKWKECIDKTEKATDCMSEFHPLKICMETHGIVMLEHDDSSPTDLS